MPTTKETGAGGISARQPGRFHAKRVGHHEKTGWIFWNVVISLIPAAVVALVGLRVRSNQRQGGRHRLDGHDGDQMETVLGAAASNPLTTAGDDIDEVGAKETMKTPTKSKTQAVMGVIHKGRESPTRSTKIADTMNRNESSRKGGQDEGDCLVLSRLEALEGKVDALVRARRSTLPEATKRRKGGVSGGGATGRENERALPSSGAGEKGTTTDRGAEKRKRNPATEETTNRDTSSDSGQDTSRGHSQAQEGGGGESTEALTKEITGSLAHKSHDEEEGEIRKDETT